MRVYDEKKSDGVRVDHKKNGDRVRVAQEKKRDGVRVNHGKERWGESSP